MSLRVHSLMKNANDLNVFFGHPIKNNMLSHKVLAIALSDIVTESAFFRVDRYSAKPAIQVMNVAVGLIFAPILVGVKPDIFEILTSCSRVENDKFVDLAQDVRKMTEYAQKYKLTIAVMGGRTTIPDRRRPSPPARSRGSP